MLPPDWPVLLRLFGHYRNGFLWVAGGISDQPDLYLESMKLIDAWVSKFSEKQ